MNLLVRWISFLESTLFKKNIEREFRELDRLASNPDLILEELRNKNSKRA